MGNWLGRLLIVGVVAAHALGQACGTWSERTLNFSPDRRSHAMSFDSTRGVAVLFGGRDTGNQYTNTTYEWNGSSWLLKGNGMPPGRVYHAMCFDSWRGVTVLFGGYVPDYQGTYASDTWEWDGTAWTNISNEGPSPRFWHEIAFDSDRGVVVLFGGKTSSGHVADTWEWDGVEWTLAATDGPSPRAAYTMAYDEQTRRVVLFGGADANTAYSDTWAWDGEVWTLLDDGTGGPANRWNHEMAYDSARGVMVVFGGDLGGYFSDETWEWDGSAWHLSETISPVARVFAAMCFDPVRQLILLQGGQGSGYSVLTGTWEYVGHAPPTILQQPEDTSVDAGNTASFHVSASAGGGLLYRWQRDGEPLFNDGRITGADTASLTIASAELDDAGAYAVVIDYECFSVTSDSATLQVVCLTDLNGDGVVDTLDVLLFLTAWSGGDSSADFNGDGTVDTRDFVVFLNAWVAGC